MGREEVTRDLGPVSGLPLHVECGIFLSNKGLRPWRGLLCPSLATSASQCPEGTSFLSNFCYSVSRGDAVLC